VHASAPTLTRAPEKNSEPLTGPAAPASSDLSFGGAANRRKIAVGELERIAAGDGTTSPALPHEARYPLKAKAGFYWQAEVEDPWIGPFESLEEASTDGKQCCFGVI
jgi:hypothetical protein